MPVRDGSIKDRKPTLSDHLAIQIRSILSQRGITQAGIAEEMGRQPAYTYQRLSGVAVIDVNDLVRFAKALDVSPLDLLASALDAVASAV